MNDFHPPLIVLVEDDKPQREEFATELKSVLPEAKVEAFSCGVAFLDAYEKNPNVMPDLFVIDLMLDWRKQWIKTTRPMPQPAPEQDKTALLCIAAVRQYAPAVPIILWTMSDLKPPAETINSGKTFFLRKDRAIEGDVYNLIRSILTVRK